MALPHLHKLCLPNSHAQFQITLTEREVQLLQALLFNNDKNAERKSGVAPKQGQ